MSKQFNCRRKFFWNQTFRVFLALLGIAVFKSKLCFGQIAGRAAGSEIATSRPDLPSAAVQLLSAPGAIAASPDGSMAVAISRPTRGGAPSCTITLVDTAKQSIITERTIPINSLGVAIDGQYVYLASLNSPVILVLSSKDLSDVKRIVVPSVAQKLAAVDGKYIFASCQTGLFWFNVPDFTPAGSEQATVTQRIGSVLRSMPDLPASIGNQWSFKGVLYNLEMQKPNLLIQPRDFVPVTANPHYPEPIIFPPGLGETMSKWGKIIVQSGGGRGLQSENEKTLLLNSLPAFAVFKFIPKNDDAASTLVGSVVLNGLVSPTQFDSYPLFEENANLEKGIQNQGPGPGMLEANGVLVIPYDDRLFFVPTKNLPGAAVLQVPMHFPLMQTKFALDPKQPTRLEQKVENGTGQIQYTLQNQVPGLTIDQSTGTVTCDPALIEPVAIDSLIVKINGGPHTDPSVGWKALDYYIAGTSESFKKLVGRDPEGVPVVLPVWIAAYDSEHHTALLDYSVFLEISKQKCADRINQLAVETVNSITTQKALDDEAHPRPSDAELLVLKLRIVQLEAENQRLREQINSMKDGTTGKAGPTTQP